ncbi:25899_t:CDS:2, partial [Racocetra persica]
RVGVGKSGVGKVGKVGGNKVNSYGKRAVQESGLEASGGVHRLVRVLLERADRLAFRAVDKGYRLRLDKALRVFEDFCMWTKESSCPASVELIKAFLGWLEMA